MVIIVNAVYDHEQKLYVKVKYGTHDGWIPQSELGALEWDGVMHA